MQSFALVFLGKLQTGAAIYIYTALTAKSERFDVR